MFAISVSQNLLADSVLMIEIELFCAGAAVPPLVPAAVAPLTCVERFATLRASRERLT